MKVLRFKDFLFENYSSAELKALLDAGLIDKEEYRRESRTTRREQYMETGDPLSIEEVRQILDTDGAKKLMAKGLHHVSSKQQLINGNIVFSLDPNYHSAEGWGIGFFSGPRIVRRMTPKGISGLVWRRTKGSMDILIRQFSDETSDLEFFNNAMAWAADHIDFDIPADKLADPRAWKYYVKSKSPRDIGPNQR